MIRFEFETGPVLYNPAHIVAVKAQEEGMLAGAPASAAPATRRGWRFVTVHLAGAHDRGWMTVRKVNRLMADMEARSE